MSRILFLNKFLSLDRGGLIYILEIMTKKHGFTLIELIVVIGIIAILATLGLSVFGGVQKKSRDAKRKSDLKEMQTALAQYYTDNGSYPSTAGAWRGSCPSCSYGSGYTDTGPTGYIPDLAPQYIQRLPHDPREGQAVNCGPNATSYLYRSDGTDYKILAWCGAEVLPISANDPFYDTIRQQTGYQVNSGQAAVAW